MWERAKGRGRVLRRRLRVRRWLVPIVGGAGGAAAGGGLLAVLMSASPADPVPGAAGVRQAVEAAYVGSRVQHALSSPGRQNVGGYARAALPPGHTGMP